MNKSVQYTIRNVPASLDAQFKAQARKQGISLNTLILKKLGAPAEKSKEPVVHHDLDWLFGTMSDSEADNLLGVIKQAKEEDKRLQAEKDKELWS